MKENYISRNNKLSVILFVIIATIQLSPPLYSSSLIKTVMAFCMIVWLFINLYKRNGKASMMVLFIFSFLIFAFIKCYIDTNTFFNPRITKVYYLCFYALSIALIDKDEIAQYKDVFWILLTIMPIWLVVSIYYGYTNENLFRAMSGSGAVNAEHYYRLGVLGYDYLFGIVCLIPSFMGILSVGKFLNKKRRILIVLNLVLDIVYIWNANYAIAFIAMAVGVLSFFIFRTRNKRVKFLTSIFFLVFFSFIIINIEAIMRGLINFFSGSYYSTKIQTLYISIVSDTDYGRLQIWQNALKSFVAYPLWGEGFIRGVNTHSELLYYLVYYGLIIGGMGIALYLAPFWLSYRNGSITSRVHHSVLLSFLIVFIFDPAGVTIGIFLYFVFFISQHIIQEYE